MAEKPNQIGFANVAVTGAGGGRQAQGTWTGADTTVQKQLSE
jgi:hypothetical protein